MINLPPFYYVGSSHGTLTVSKSGRVLEVFRERSCDCRPACYIENVLWVDLPEYFEFFGEEVGFHHIDILDCNLILDPVEVDPTVERIERGEELLGVVYGDEVTALKAELKKGS